MGPSPAAVAAPAPALDPPVVVPVFQGLRVMPVSGLSPSPFQPNSGVVVFPNMTPPACLRRRTTGGSTPDPGRSTLYYFNSVSTPLGTDGPFTAKGQPWSGPR